MQRVKLTKTLTLMLIIAALVLALTPILSAQDGGLLATVVTDVWLRSGPGVEWRRIIIVPAGTTVALDGREASGFWVRGITSSGDVGWMAAPYLTPTPQQIQALPAFWVEQPFNLAAPVQGSGPAVTTGAASGEPSPGTPVTIRANVNMRSGPSTAYRRVGGVSAGETINVDGRDGLLSWVRGINSAGEVGWVSAEFISLSFNELAALPVVGVNTPFNTIAPGGGPAPAPAAAAPSFAPAPPITSTVPSRGFAYGGHIQNFSDNTIAWMQRAGMTWIKKQVRFLQGESGAGAAWIINEAHARGFRVMLGVVGQPGQLLNDGYFDDYARFVGELAAAGADAIEVWNEPNIDREWPAGLIDPAMYTRLLATSYNAIKAANPGTMVISGAPAPTGFFGGCSGAGCDDAPYVRGMAAAGAANYMDCIGIHYNEGIVSPRQTSGDPRSEYFTRYFWGMVNTYHAAFGGRRPLCFTELGYLSPEGYGPLPGGFAWAGNVTVAQQTAWVNDAVRLSASSGRVRLVIIWNMDFTDYGADPMAGYAIIRPGNVCPACEALGR